MALFPIPSYDLRKVGTIMHDHGLPPLFVHPPLPGLQNQGRQDPLCMTTFLGSS